MEHLAVAGAPEDAPIRTFNGWVIALVRRVHPHELRRDELARTRGSAGHRRDDGESGGADDEPMDIAVLSAA